MLTHTLALARLLAHLDARPHAPSASTLARARFGANALQRTGTLTAAHPLARSHASPPARSLASSLAGPLEPRAPTSSLALSLARALASASATAVPTRRLPSGGGGEPCACSSRRPSMSGTHQQRAGLRWRQADATALCQSERSRRRAHVLALPPSGAGPSGSVSCAIALRRCGGGVTALQRRATDA